MFDSRIAAAILLLLASGFANAGEDGPLVVIQDYKFIPQHIEVKKCATVVWENREKRPNLPPRSPGRRPVAGYLGG